MSGVQGAVAAPAAATPSAPAPASNAPAKAPEAKTEAPDFKSTKHKVKFGGQEAEVDYDELVRGYQNAKESTRRYQEASQKLTEAQKVDQALANGDTKFLVEKLGPEKARKIFEDYLIEQMQYEQLPPAEKALRSERQKREALEKQIADSQQEQQQAERERVSQAAYEDLDREVGDALKAVGKQATPRLALRILDHIEAGIRAGAVVPASKAYEFAVQGIKEDIGHYMTDMPIEEAAKIIPKEFLDRLMSHQVNQVLDKKQAKRSPAPRAQESEAPKSINDWFKEKEKIIKK